MLSALLCTSCTRRSTSSSISFLSSASFFIADSCATLSPGRTSSRQDRRKDPPHQAFDSRAPRDLSHTGSVRRARPYGRMTTLTQPSCLSRKVLYSSGPSSSPASWVMTKPGSIWPFSIRLSHPDCARRPCGRLRQRAHGRRRSCRRVRPACRPPPRRCRHGCADRPNGRPRLPACRADA